MRTSSKKVPLSISENRLNLIGKRRNILLAFADSGELSESQIAELLKLDPGNLSHYIRELEAVGLVDTREAKVGKGNDRVMVSLSKQGFQVLDILKEGEKPQAELGQAPEELFSYFLMQLLGEAEEVRRYAASELKDICKACRLTQQSELFTYLEGGLKDYGDEGKTKVLGNPGLLHEKDRDVLLDLLTAIGYVISNSPETLPRIKKGLVKPLQSIASSDSEIDDKRVTDKAIDLIAAIHGGEYGYQLLWDIYKALLDKSSASATTAINALAKHTKKNEQLHTDLMELFKTAPKEKRDLIKVHRTHLLPFFK